VRDRNFLRLWTATTIDSFGTWLLLVAVPLQAVLVLVSAAVAYAFVNKNTGMSRAVLR
jgi:hypothetical protein